MSHSSRATTSVNRLRRTVRARMTIEVDTSSESEGGDAEENVGALDGNPEGQAGANPELQFPCEALFNGLFDAFTITTAVTDVITDILIAAEWYRAGEMTFFWLGITIFILAQIGYSILFMVMFDPTIHGVRNVSIPRSFCAWLLVLPFGQLVPLVMWAVAVGVPGVEAGLNMFGFVFMGIDEREHPDPVARYLVYKVKTHGGFVIESFIEALPQSLLQLIYIVRVGEVSALNAFSITISIISIASKGIILAYHVDRRTFLFNYLCVVYDVFNVFAVVVWLFTFTAHDTAYHFFIFGSGVDFELLSTIWLWKEFLLVCAPLVLVVLGIIAAVGESIVNGCECDVSCKEVCQLAVAYFFLILICGVAVLPVLIVVETVRFALVPLLVFESYEGLDNPFRSNFYAKLYSFLLGGDDFAERYRCFFIAETIASLNYDHDGIRVVEAPPLADVVALPVVSLDELKKHRHASALNYALTCGKGNFSFATLRSHLGMTVGGVMEKRRVSRQSPDDADEESDEYRVYGGGYAHHRPSPFMKVMNKVYGVYGVIVGVPLIGFGSLFSFLFPLLAFFTRDVLGGEVPRFPLTLTSIQLGLLFLMICLAPRVLRIAQIELHRTSRGSRTNNIIFLAMSIYSSNTDDELDMYYAIRDAPHGGMPHLFRWNSTWKDSVEYIPYVYDVFEDVADPETASDDDNDSASVNSEFSRAEGDDGPAAPAGVHNRSRGDTPGVSAVPKLAPPHTRTGSPGGSRSVSSSHSPSVTTSDSSEFSA